MNDVSNITESYMLGFAGHRPKSSDNPRLGIVLNISAYLFLLLMKNLRTLGSAWGKCRRHDKEPRVSYEDKKAPRS